MKILRTYTIYGRRAAEKSKEKRKKIARMYIYMRFRVESIILQNLASIIKFAYACFTLALIYPNRGRSQDRSPQNFFGSRVLEGLRVDFGEPVLGRSFDGKVIGQSYVPLARIRAFRVPRRRF